MNFMTVRNFYNKDGERLYVLHFPGSGMKYEDAKKIIADTQELEFTVSSDISIISTMTKDYWSDSILKKQCDKNGVEIINPAINESNWNNTKKIGYILEALDAAGTKYCLILDGRDVQICRNLDSTFIEKFKTLGYPIIYNGTPNAYPDAVVEPIQETIRIKGKQKYLNAGVCVGEREVLRDFYTKAAEINAENPNNHSEQLIIRKTRKKYPALAGWDSDNRIFRIIHTYDTKVVELDDGYMLI